MRFDVIVGNPPYHRTDGGHGTSARPLYHLFVRRALELRPKRLVMIIPSRWFGGGKGLDKFRGDMLGDGRVRELVDFENFRDVFPGVDLAGGACYFLWSGDEEEGPCAVTNFSQGGRVTATRRLDEFEIFVRQNRAVDIVRKIKERREGGRCLDAVASPRKPFGLPTNYRPLDSGVPCWFIQKIGLRHAGPGDVRDPNDLLGKWKLLLPIAPIAGQTDFAGPVGFYHPGNTIVAKPGECCTESYFAAGTFATEREALSMRSYLFTKTARFLLLQAVVSQHVTRRNFCFVPDVAPYDRDFTDEILRARWGVTDSEWAYIDSKITSVGLSADQ